MYDYPHTSMSCLFISLHSAIRERTRASTTRETPRVERTAKDSVSARTPRLVLPLRRRTSVKELRRVDGRMASVLIRKEDLLDRKIFLLPLLRMLKIP